ncbi:M50 family metallopeptidase [Mariniblastus sp.]|nr:M50 family metallopeptidase [Mariniblastus sp.]
MAFHELGHVVGALVTGGVVEQVVLHPLTISRTDVSPNPNPLLVVWMGPVLGCLVPLICCWLVPRRLTSIRNIAIFFAGFCLLANGAYIAFGSFDRVGDCGDMLSNGSPFWTLLLFGAVTIPFGFFVWHRLGPVRNFLADPTLVKPATGYALLGVLVVVLALEFSISPIK